MLLKSIDEIQKMSESDSTWTNSKGQTIAINQVRESNRKKVMQNLWENKEIKWFRESFRKKFGFDFADRKAFPVMEDGFDWNRVAGKLGYPSLDVAFKEADSGSNFVQVLRAGVQSIVNAMYETVPTTFESWTTAVNSKRDTELYAPLWGISFLQEVGKQELYGESRAAGLDIKLRNRKYGTLYAVEKELLEDDQTGQFAKQAGLLGEYAKLAIEAIVYAKLAGVFTGGVSGQYANLVIPNTETKPSTETNYPWVSASQGGFAAGKGVNKPNTFSILTQTGVQAGFIGLMNQLNGLGLKMNVDPNRLIIGPQYRFDAAILLNSSFYPSVPGGSGPGSAPGSYFAINPLESIAALTITRFMFKNDGTVDGTSKAWYLVDDKKPWFVAQIRQAAEVTQENPNAGESFNRDIIRFKLSLRVNADHIEPRFAWQGNDGSVTS